jgi:hypothetical protein
VSLTVTATTVDYDAAPGTEKHIEVYPSSPGPPGPPGTGTNNVITGDQDDPELDCTSITSTLAGPGSSYAAAAGVAIGPDTYATSHAIAIGSGSVAGDDTDADTLADSQDTIALGTGAGAYATRGIAIGAESIVAVPAERGIAIGDQAQASGIQSIAIGAVNPNADAWNCIALGTNAFAIRDFCLALGVNTYAGGLTGTTDAIAIGRAASATGNQGIAIGHNAQAVNDYAVHLGSVSTPATMGAHGRSSVAVGVDASTAATAFGAVAVGRSAAAEAAGAIGLGSAQAMGQDAIAVGTGALASDTVAIAIGNAARAQFPGSVALGADATGAGAQSANTNDFALGTTQHHYRLPGLSGTGTRQVGADPSGRLVAGSRLISIGPTPPASPAVGDVWIDIS